MTAPAQPKTGGTASFPGRCRLVAGVEVPSRKGGWAARIEGRRANRIGPDDAAGIGAPQPDGRCGCRIDGEPRVAQKGEMRRGVIHAGPGSPAQDIEGQQIVNRARLFRRPRKARACGLRAGANPNPEGVKHRRDPIAGLRFAVGRPAPETPPGTPKSKFFVRCNISIATHLIPWYMEGVSQRASGVDLRAPSTKSHAMTSTSSGPGDRQGSAHKG